MTALTNAVEGQSSARSAPHLQATGGRIEELLNASSSGGAVARERAEELVRLVVELYGAGLERMLTILYDAGQLNDAALDALAADELVAGLLLVHGLHPEPVQVRIEHALEDVRPYLRTHGGNVELLEVDDDGTIRLRMLGSCDGCASSAETLALAVEGAIRDAAPEVGVIEVDSPAAGTGQTQHVQRGTDTLIPVESLRVRRPDRVVDGIGHWESIPSLDDIEPGELRAVTVASVPIVVCRVGGDLFAFRDSCPSCGDDLARATIERRLGGGIGDAVLQCRRCGAHYDVQRAGTCIENSEEHLDPLPVLTRRGGVEVALPSSVHA